MHIPFVLACVILGGVSLSSCASTQSAAAMTPAECGKSRTCKISGLLEMSNDGHAFIGVLHLEGGGCVNVSLPEKEMDRRNTQPPQQATIVGEVLPYVHEDMFDLRINGRRIG